MAEIERIIIFKCLILKKAGKFMPVFLFDE